MLKNANFKAKRTLKETATKASCVLRTAEDTGRSSLNRAVLAAPRGGAASLTATAEL